MQSAAPQKETAKIFW